MRHPDMSNHRHPTPSKATLARCLTGVLAMWCLSCHALDTALGDVAQPGLKMGFNPLAVTVTDTTPEATTAWRLDTLNGPALLARQEARTSTLRWRLLGDYYFAPSLGWRATGGIQTQWDTTQEPSNSSLRLSAAAFRTTPYVGLGYSSSGRNPDRWGGWSLAADMGILATRGGSGLQLGHAFDNTAGTAGELLRELRFTPVLQLGASYSF